MQRAKKNVVPASVRFIAMKELDNIRNKASVDDVFSLEGLRQHLNEKNLWDKTFNISHVKHMLKAIEWEPNFKKKSQGREVLETLKHQDSRIQELELSIHNCEAKIKKLEESVQKLFPNFRGPYIPQ